MPTLLAINVGNTRVGLGAFQLPAPLHVPRLLRAASVPLGAFRPRGPGPRFIARADDAVFASVNPPAERAVLAWVRRRFGLDPLRFPGDVPAPLRSRYRPPRSLGADRLAAAVAAFAEARSACIIVDAGTAITVDAVSRDAVFLGGVILPGLALSATALACRTALLPRVRLRAPARVTATSTASAISAGVMHGLAGAVDRLIDDLARELRTRASSRARPLVFVTGGDAPALLPLCRTRMLHRPHLVLTGLALSACR